MPVGLSKPQLFYFVRGRDIHDSHMAYILEQLRSLWKAVASHDAQIPKAVHTVA